MENPRLELYAETITANTKVIVQQCKRMGVDVVGVTKVAAGLPGLAAAMSRGGVQQFADSRVDNIRKMREAGIEGKYMLLRSPMNHEWKEVVALCDTSLQSDLQIIEGISKLAWEHRKIHEIILMVDLGDLREGVLPYRLVPVVEKITRLHGVKLIGMGTNLTCYGGIIPDLNNLSYLARLAEEIESIFHMDFTVISGGNSSSLPLLLEGKLPPKVNQLRIGEGIIFGRETVTGTVIPGCCEQTVGLFAEVIEVKTKPAMPMGEQIIPPFGESKHIGEGLIRRAIVAIGQQDIIPEGIIPIVKGIEVLGASSDHLLLNISEADQDIRVGDEIGFTLTYPALLSAMTSPYVRKYMLPSPTTW